jgi:hypothetical protein
MLSEGVMGVDIATFAGLRQDFTGGYSAGNNSNELTAKEILDRLMGGSGGMTKTWQDAGGIPQVMMTNAKKNIGMILFATVGVPVAFKVGRKLLAKNIANPVNKLLRQTSLGVKV